MQQNEDLLKQIERAREAVRENPEKLAAWSHLGLLLGKAGRIEEAREALQRALSLDPDNAFIRGRLEVLAKPPQEREKIASEYLFTPPVEMKKINRRIKIAGIVILLLLILLPVKFIFFGSTRKLVVNKYNNSFPKWSPGGHYLSFRSNKSKSRLFSPRRGGELYIADADGSNIHPFRIEGLDSPYEIGRYAWSFDDRYIAFELFDHYQRYICVTSYDGTGFKKIEKGKHPVWSPVDHRLIYSMYDSDAVDYKRLVMYDFDTNRREILVMVPASDVAWSPDGEWIAYTEFEDKPTMDPLLFNDMDMQFMGYSWFHTGKIYKLSIASKEKFEVSPGNDCRYPVWLPDGDGLLYLRIAHKRIWLYRKDFSEDKEERLYDVTGIDITEQPLVMDPKGRWVAFERNYTVPVTEPPQGSIPDRFLGFVTPDDRMVGRKKVNIFLAATDGSDMHPLENLDSSKMNPAFSADGKWIAYSVTPLDDPAQIWKTRVK